MLTAQRQAKKATINSQVEIPRNGFLGGVLKAHISWDRLPKPIVSVEQERHLPRIHEVVHVAGWRLQDAACAAPGAAAAS